MKKIADERSNLANEEESVETKVIKLQTLVEEMTSEYEEM